MASSFIQTRSFFGGALVIDESGTPVVGSIELKGDTGGVLGAITDATLSTAGIAAKAAETKLAGGEFDPLTATGEALTQPRTADVPLQQPITQAEGTEGAASAPAKPSTATLLLGVAVALLLLRG
jgi:hypothetical protein